MKWITKALSVVALAGAALGVAACSDGPSHGYVWAKQYSPPSSWYTSGHYVSGSCYGSGSSRYCSSGYWSPGYWTYYPAEWQFDLCSEPIGHSDSKNSCGWRDVADSDYQRYALNSWYTVDPKYPYPTSVKSTARAGG
jgi:hypothetical protein